MSVSEKFLKKISQKFLTRINQIVKLTDSQSSKVRSGFSRFARSYGSSKNYLLNGARPPGGLSNACCELVERKTPFIQSSKSLVSVLQDDSFQLPEQRTTESINQGQIIAKLIDREAENQDHNGGC